MRPLHIPLSRSICGTCVVLPEPVGATKTRRFPSRSDWTICPWICQIGSEVCTLKKKTQRKNSSAAKTAADNPSIKPEGMNFLPLAKRMPKKTNKKPTKKSAM